MGKPRRRLIPLVLPFQNNFDYLLNKINWLMPFFIQLSVQELADIFDETTTLITKKIVDRAFHQICNRRNNIHFDSYYNRLRDTFSAEDYALAIQILNTVAAKTEISKDALFDGLEAEKQHLNAIIESLDYDGYINLRSNNYSFNSPILRLWWNKYIAVK